MRGAAAKGARSTATRWLSGRCSGLTGWLIVLAALVLAVLLLLPEREGREVERVTSPDGTHDAVLLSFPGGGGAAGALGSYQLYVVGAGEEVANVPNARPELVARSLGEERELRWRDDRLLEFAYQSAEIVEFRNAVLLPESTRKNSEYIELRLVGPESGSGLPKRLLEKDRTEATASSE